jgi:hypothetical protein
MGPTLPRPTGSSSSWQMDLSLSDKRKTYPSRDPPPISKRQAHQITSQHDSMGERSEVLPPPLHSGENVGRTARINAAQPSPNSYVPPYRDGDSAWLYFVQRFRNEQPHNPAWLPFLESRCDSGKAILDSPMEERVFLRLLRFTSAQPWTEELWREFVRRVDAVFN